jgi:hypothetical protein
VSYTKGPWVCGTKGFSFPNLKSWQVIPVGTRPDPISQDDLNLIATAPELLEALTALLDAEWMVTHDWGGDREAVLNAAKASISKAKGEK